MDITDRDRTNDRNKLCCISKRSTKPVNYFDYTNNYSMKELEEFLKKFDEHIRYLMEERALIADAIMELRAKRIISQDIKYKKKKA